MTNEYLKIRNMLFRDVETAEEMIKEYKVDNTLAVQIISSYISIGEEGLLKDLSEISDSIKSESKMQCTEFYFTSNIGYEVDLCSVSVYNENVYLTLPLYDREISKICELQFKMSYDEYDQFVVNCSRAVKYYDMQSEDSDNALESMRNNVPITILDHYYHKELIIFGALTDYQMKHESLVTDINEYDDELEFEISDNYNCYIYIYRSNLWW